MHVFITVRPTIGSPSSTVAFTAVTTRQTTQMNTYSNCLKWKKNARTPQPKLSSLSFSPPSPTPLPDPESPIGRGTLSLHSLSFLYTFAFPPLFIPFIPLQIQPVGAGGSADGNQIWRILALKSGHRFG